MKTTLPSLYVARLLNLIVERFAYFLFATIGVLFNTNLSAQTSEVIESRVYVSSTSQCVVPASVSFDIAARINTNFDKCDILVQFGDGEEQIFKVTNFGGWDSAMAYHTYQTEGNYHVALTYIFPDISIVRPLDSPVIITTDCGNVSGKVYRDANKDCVADQEEYYTQYCMLHCKYGGTTYYTYTYEGKYSFNVPNGVPYVISLATADENGKLSRHNGGGVSCPVKYEGNSSKEGIDFGISCSNFGNDLGLNASFWGYRPGFVAEAFLSAYNFDCNEADATLKYTLNTLETYISSDPAPDRINGKDLEWDISNFRTASNISLKIHVDEKAVIGNDVCRNMSVSPVSGDIHPEDNQKNICNQVSGAWDPNDINVLVASSGKEGSSIKVADDVLIYHIRFQNTGTDTAFNIYVRDAIDKNLDPASISILGSSHPMQVTMNHENIATFRF